MLKVTLVSLALSVATLQAGRTVANEPPPTAADPSAPTAYDEIATRFVSLLVEGKHAQAAARFDATMSAALSPTQLRALWASMSTAHGAFIGMEPGHTVVVPASRAVPYTTAYVPVRWEQNRLRMKIVFDREARIAGLFFVAPPSPGTEIKPAYLDPVPVIEHEVIIGEEPWQLPGLLALPKAGEPRAGVVLVHGSGPQDHDETIGPNKPFRDLAHGLGQHGILTLRYDKRTFVHGPKMSHPGLFTIPMLRA